MHFYLLEPYFYVTLFIIDLSTLNSASSISSCLALYAWRGFRSTPGFRLLRPPDLGAEISDLVGEISDLVAEISDLEAEISDIGAEISDIKAEISYYGVEI